MPVRNRVSVILGERRENISSLAEGAGIAMSTAHSLYHDRVTLFSAKTLERVCRYLGRDIGEVLYLDPPLGYKAIPIEIVHPEEESGPPVTIEIVDPDEERE